ncbi:MAG: VRR-NUC domain-containing protein [Cetobacterium sp.]
MLSEIEIQGMLIDYLMILENRGTLFFQRTNNNAIYDTKSSKFRRAAKGQKKGFPDIMVIKDGRTIGIEVKAENGRQSEHQKEIEHLFKKNGAEYYIVRSLKELKEILK